MGLDNSVVNAALNIGVQGLDQAAPLLTGALEKLQGLTEYVERLEKLGGVGGAVGAGADKLTTLDYQIGVVNSKLVSAQANVGALTAGINDYLAAGKQGTEEYARALEELVKAKYDLSQIEDTYNDLLKEQGKTQKEITDTASRAARPDNTFGGLINPNERAFQQFQSSLNRPDENELLLRQRTGFIGAVAGLGAQAQNPLADVLGPEAFRTQLTIPLQELSPVLGNVKLSVEEVTNRFLETAQQTTKALQFIQQLKEIGGSFEDLQKTVAFVNRETAGAGGAREKLAQSASLQAEAEAKSLAAQTAAVAAKETEIAANTEAAVSTGRKIAATEVEQKQTLETTVQVGALTAARQGETAAIASETTSLVAGSQSVAAASASQSAATTGLATSMAAAIVPLAAMSAVFFAINKAAEDSQKPLEDYIDSLEQVQTSTIQVSEVLRQGGQEQLDTIRETEEAKLAILQQQRDDQQKIIEGFQDELNKVGDSGTDFLSGFLAPALIPLGVDDKLKDTDVAGKALSATLDALGFDTDASEEKMAALDEQIKTVNENLKNLNDAWTESLAVTNDLIAANREANELDKERARLFALTSTEALGANIRTNEAEQQRLRRNLAENAALFNSALGPDAEKAIEEENKKLQARLDEVVKQRELLSSGLTLQVVSINEGISDAEKELSTLQNATTSQVDNQVQNLQNQIQAREAALEQLRALQASLDPQSQAAQDLALQTATVETDLAGLTKEMQFWDETVRESAKARQAEAEAAALENKRVGALDKLSEEAERNAAALAGATKELEAYNAELDKQAERQATRDDYNNRIRLAQEAEAAQARQAQIKDILDNEAKQTADSTLKFQATQTTQAKQYQEGQLEKDTRYQEQSLKAQEDFNLRRLRAQEDLQDQLLEAVENNDVRSFINLQKQADKRFEREDQDQDKATAERQKQRAKEQQADVEAFNKRLEEQTKQFEEQQKARLEQDAARIEQIQASGKQELKASDQLRQALAEQEDQWRKLDAEAQVASRRAQLQDKINGLQEEGSTLHDLQLYFTKQQVSLTQQMYDTIIKYGFSANEVLALQAQEGANVLKNLQQGAQIGTFDKPVSTSNQSGNAITKNFKGIFGEGGIIDEPTVGLFGESPINNDWVIPVPKNGNFAEAINRLAGQTGGMMAPKSPPSINVTVQELSVGRFAEASDLDRLHRDVQQTILQAASAATASLS